MSVKEESEKAALKPNIQKSKIMASGPITSWEIDGEKMETATKFFSWTPKSPWTVTAPVKLKDACSLEEKLWQIRQCIKKQRHHFADKDLYSWSYGFSGTHVWMWELDCKESWVLKNWCFWTVGLEKTPETPLDSKEVKTVSPKGYQSWLFIGSTGAEAEASILWPSVRRTDSLEKTLMLEKI